MTLMPGSLGGEWERGKGKWVLGMGLGLCGVDILRVVRAGAGRKLVQGMCSAGARRGDRMERKGKKRGTVSVGWDLEVGGSDKDERPARVCSSRPWW